MRKFYSRCHYLAAALFVSVLPFISYGQGAPDCTSAIVLCSSASISFNPQGIGAVNDFAPAANSQGCLFTGERNTAWYYFEFDNTMPANSVITFTIAPNGLADYDFALYGPGVSCSGLGSPVRCSYAAPSAPTGLGNGATEASEGAGGDGFVAPLPVQPGQGYYLVVDNFSSNNTSFNMSWGGSAAPYLDCNATPPCNVALNYPANYTVCAGSGPITLQGNINGATGAPSINWSGTNGGDAYLSNPFIANPTVNIPAGASGTFQFTITVTQDDCIEEATVTVNAGAIPQPSITGNNLICPGQSITLSATPGFSGYSWSNNQSGPTISVSSANTYSVTVTNSQGCQGSASFTVSPASTPVPVISGPGQLCINGNAILDAGGGFDSYQWSTGSPNQLAAVTGPGTYQVTVTQDGCQGTGQITIQQSQGIGVFPTGDNTICPAGTADIDAGPGYVSYQWNNGSQQQVNTVTAQGTYSVTVEDDFGCQGTGSFTVSPAFPPEPVITGNLAICSGNATTLDAGVQYYGYQWSTGSSSSVITVNQPGPYWVTVTDARGCTGSTMVTVTAAPGPEPVIDGDTSICAGGSTQLVAEAGYSSYQWSNNATGPAIQATAGGAYSVTVTDDVGCQGIASVEVVEYDSPAPVIQAPARLCPGESATLTLDGQYQSYAWSAGGTADSASVPGPGDYAVTVTDANGCEGMAAVSIQEFAPPSPPVGVEVGFCSGDTASLFAPAGFAAYQWEGGSTDSLIRVDAPGNYAYTVTDNNGCTGAGSIIAVENTLPDFTISGELEYCETASTSLQAPAGYAGYLWSTGDTGAVADVSASGPVSVVVTDSNGCSSEQAVTVVEHPLPAVNINGLLEFCTDGSTTLSGDTGFDAYAWSDGSSQPSITVSQPGNYSLTVTDDNGCSNSATVAVAEISELQPDINGALQYCAGASATLEGEPGYYSYSWSTGATGPSIEVSAPGTVVLTVADNNGCEGTVSVDISELPLPQPAITGQDFFCEGTAATIDAGGGYAAYAWTGGDSTRQLTVTQPGVYTVTVADANSCEGTASFEVEEIPTPAPVISGDLVFCPEGATALNAVGNFASFLWSNGDTTAFTSVDQPGAYSLTVTDSYGCEGSASVDAAHFATSPPQIGGSLNYCPGESTTLDGEAGFASYLWSNGGMSSSITVNADGAYGLTVTDANGCQTSAEVMVEAYTVSLPQISGDSAFCAGGAAALQAGAGFEAYNWSTGSTQPSITVSSGGLYSLTATDANGCSTSSSFSVAENALPVVNIDGATSFCAGEATILSADAQYEYYNWSDGSTGPTVQASQAGAYTLSVTDANGCQGTASVEVEEIPLPTPVISGELMFCPEGSTELSIGNNYPAYLWSDGTTGAFTTVDQPGTYSLTVTDGFGCEGNTSVDVAHFSTSPPQISGSLNYCPGESTTLDGETGFSGYLWSNGAVNSSITVNADGAYGLTVTDANGCRTSAEVTVEAYTVNQPQVSGDDAFCAGETAALQAGAGFDSYIWSTGSAQPSITVGSGGVYSVTATDANGCNTSDSFSVTENPLPVVNIGGSTSYCIGGSTTLNGGAQYASYNWSDGSTAPTLQVNQPGLYGLTVTDANGCVGSAEVQVAEDIELNPAISGPLAFCPGASTTLDAGAGFQTYQWSDNSTGQVLVANSPGAYSVTVTDASGCTGDATVEVAEHPAPMPAIEGDLEYCAGSSTSLSVTGGSFAAYNWSTGAVGPEITTSQPGSYTVSITDVNGCGETASVEVQENPLPVFQISGPLSFCEGDATTLSAPDGFADYLWSNGAREASITVPSPGNYGLTVTNSFGCTSQHAVSTTQVPQPQADAGLPQVINCYASEVTLGGNGSSQGANIIYQWSGPGIGASNENEQFPTVSAPGEYTLSAVNTILGCTSEPSVVEVTDDTDDPVVVLEALDVLDCVTPSVMVAAGNSSTGPDYTYEWFDANMAPISNQGLTLNATAPGAYFLLITDTGSGCDALGSVEVEENVEYPGAEAGPPQHLDCEANTVSLDGTGSQNGASVVYNWSTASGRILSGGNSLAPSVDEPGTYVIMVTNTENGCSSTDSVLVTQDIEVPAADAGAPQEISCLYPTVPLDGSGSSAGSQYVYQWAFGQPDSIVGSGLNYTASEPGTYFIIVTDTGNGCANTDAVVVSQNAAAPSGINLALDDPTCFGDADGSVIISGVVGGTPPYLYSFDGQPLNGQSVFPNLPAGTYSIRVQDAIGCEYELEATLEEGNDLMVDLGEDRTVKLGEEVELQALVNIDESEIASLSWNGVDSLSCRDCLRPMVRPSTSGSYFIEVIDENGCAANSQVSLFLDKTRSLYLPNVFSPNGDGKNDVFHPFAGPEVTRIRAFEIYNRWGEPVFEIYNFLPNDPTYGWDGTYRAELFNGAVFTWFAEVEFVDGVVELFKGDVVLMR